MDMGLRDCAVLGTGGSSGIGRATAIAFGREGARVTITYRSDRDPANRVARGNVSGAYVPVAGGAD